ncbi:putative glycine dehydrogenase-like protein [Emericellopsis cladophorae]|uniref:Glycine cleavage system P protein n=1 Tax=Emericellopsis cladophorae TaxID=2686198 RepID=A0A9P9Y8M6_9HYPO|nr:putative glycine dehydrogenase-like protein [Emericellopsis cladophorae]KAI6785373.1 putative glycine dehydrogenase-like protein [Emericellopsis cladophorae]
MASRLACSKGAAASVTSAGCRAAAGRRTVLSATTSRAAAVPTQRRFLAHQAEGRPRSGDQTWEQRVQVNDQATKGPWNHFVNRHIGPRDSDVEQMLATVGAKNNSMDDFIAEVIPKNLQSSPRERIVPEMHTNEPGIMAEWTGSTRNNATRVWMNGEGYYPVATPSVIKRNILENPAWYTSYTPYQAEISQGRLESLLNFQTMVSDLTGLSVANASLLDEGTAGAEAMIMSLNCLPASRQKGKNKTFVISNKVHKRTFRVIEGRAKGFGVNIKRMDIGDVEGIRSIGNDLVGVMAQYPDYQGSAEVLDKVAEVTHDLGCQFSVATDLSALTVLKPPGEFGADIAFGNSQRFGVPLGYGGPHAAFFATKEANKRRLPGRIVGVTKDRMGRPALRLALQTREQHIRREKATSNVCTAQALLANMAAMYAVYHGPEQLMGQAVDNIRGARMIAEVGRFFGLEVRPSQSCPDQDVFTDTVTLHNVPDAWELKTKLEENADIGVGVGAYRSSQDPTGYVTCAVSGNVTHSLLFKLATQLQNHLGKEDDVLALVDRIWNQSYKVSDQGILDSIPKALRRTSSYLTHPVFNTHHSETEILRYIHHLASKDLSQVHSMIPLGSCTMKLNGTAQLELIGLHKVASVHPAASPHDVPGYKNLITSISRQLATLTGLDATSVQPNSGAQGEFAGLQCIRKYFEANGQKNRDICLIPMSAHGTNPASATQAGLRTVPVKCDTKTGNLDLADLKAKCEKHANELAAIMITYPSTYGVFEPDIMEICKTVHDHGGKVYMDGANMNAQIGLTSPGYLGADVCHLNLHKTFCIPHGGGGPGVGPICVTEALEPYLPGKQHNHVSSALFGSASILPISWAYMRLMRDEGLVKATKVALLNANYLLARLKDHYPIVYTNAAGRCAHEFIIDIRPFGKSAGIDVADISKRLQDYGFHSPTMSFPISGTLMIEPTESESKAELDRFADALISIREEIREIEEGKQPREGNVLKMSPHPQVDVIKGDGEGKWERPYSREKAAYPLPYLVEKKFWPTVGRADDAFGDTNLFCTCPPVEDTTEQD